MSSPGSAATSPFSVVVDPDRRRLHLRFSGTVVPADIAGQVPRVAALSAQLGPSFTLVTDLSGLESMDIDCGPQITRLMDACRAAGVGRVVRIIPHPRKDIGFNLLSLVHYRGEVPTATCKTAEEAEQELAKAPLT